MIIESANTGPTKPPSEQAGPTRRAPVEPPGSIAAAATASGPPRDRAPGPGALAPGLALATAVAAVATAVGRLLPVVGGPVTGIVLGVLLAVLLKPGTRLRPGISFASRPVLQTSVVLLGGQLSLAQVVRVGLGSLPVMLGTLAVCLAAAYGIGRALGVVGDVRTLIGVGTGICGASAIAAVTPVIGAAEAEVTYAISTIFVFNIAAVLVFPPLGHLLGMSQHAFGLFAGTAVNDMSSVVAASSTYGSAAASYAVVVKLTRTLMIIPVCLGLSALANRVPKAVRPADAAATAGAATPDAGTPRAGTPDAGNPRDRAARVRAHKLVPWFLVGFLLTAGLNTAGLVPERAHQWLVTLSVFLITVALCAIGLSTDPARLRRAGIRPLVLGGCLWVTVAGTALLLYCLTAHL